MKPATRRRIWSGVSLLLFLALLVMLTILFSDDLIDLVGDPDAFQQRMDTLGIGGYLLFMTLMAAQVVLAVIPGQPFEFVGGYCFGIFRGTLLVLLGAAVGSAIAFWLARFMGTRVVTAFYPEEKLQQMSFLRASEKQNLLTFLAFLIPGIPKDLLAYFMGLTRMHFSTFLLISTVGRLPGVILAVLSGTAIQSRNTPLIIVSVSMILLLMLFSFLYYRRKSRLSQKTSAPSEDTQKDDTT